LLFANIQLHLKIVEDVVKIVSQAGQIHLLVPEIGAIIYSHLIMLR